MSIIILFLNKIAALPTSISYINSTGSQESVSVDAHLDKHLKKSTEHNRRHDALPEKLLGLCPANHTCGYCTRGSRLP
jgi:hypothetical protein